MKATFSFNLLRINLFNDLIINDGVCQKDFQGVSCISDQKVEFDYNFK